MFDPDPSARCTWRSRSPERLDHLDGVGARDGRVREVEGRRRVVLLEQVPVREVGRDLAAAGPPREHVLDREGHVGLVLHAVQPVDEAAGVLALPAERRVHHDGRRADPLGRGLGALQLGPRSVDQTRWVSSRHGAWIASTGTPNRSDSARSASGSWLTGSVHTMTSTPSKPRSAAISKAVVQVSG